MIIGTTIESIDAKKFGAHPGNLRIDHNVSIKNISDIKLPLFPKEKITKIDFEFKTTYVPQTEDKKEIKHIILSSPLFF